MVIAGIESILLFLFIRWLVGFLVTRQVARRSQYWLSMGRERIDEWEAIFGKTPLDKDDGHIMARAYKWQIWSNYRVYGEIVPGVLGVLILVTALADVFLGLSFRTTQAMIWIGGGFLICAIMVHTLIVRHHYYRETTSWDLFRKGR